jgi:hypothetical protein
MRTVFDAVRRAQGVVQPAADRPELLERIGLARIGHDAAVGRPGRGQAGAGDRRPAPGVRTEQGRSRGVFAAADGDRRLHQREDCAGLVDGDRADRVASEAGGHRVPDRAGAGAGPAARVPELPVAGDAVELVGVHRARGHEHQLGAAKVLRDLGRRAGVVHPPHDLALPGHRRAGWMGVAEVGRERRGRDGRGDHRLLRRPGVHHEHRPLPERRGDAHRRGLRASSDGGRKRGHVAGADATTW